MENEEQNLIYRIKRKRSSSSLFGNSVPLSFIHDSIVDRLKSHGNFYDNSVEHMDTRAKRVLVADKKMREAVSELIHSLAELNDKEIALKLIGDHIVMLNSFFKEFE